ncbi:hypothetical protein [Candidatus Poriferisodalis sp.]
MTLLRCYTYTCTAFVIVGGVLLLFTPNTTLGVTFTVIGALALAPVPLRK